MDFEYRDNTFFKKVRANPRDAIDIEIGDSKQPDFKPQAKMIMLNKWDYSGADSVCYSDENCESYKKAAEFLGPDQPVEDWGGGTGWGKVVI